MKVAFFSEVGHNGNYPRNFQNCRTDVAWAIALDAPVYNINVLDINLLPARIELGIIIIPKKNPERAFRFHEKHKLLCKKWAVMQEGPHWLYQDWKIENQLHFLNFLSEMDVLFCHNDIDRRYYTGIYPEKDVRVLQSVMIEDSINTKKLILSENRKGVIIGGNWTSWYSGSDSYVIASLFDEDIYSVSMGRKQADENNIDGINYLPYVTWNEWIQQLSQFKYAVHLMRTYAAGTFPLNCAYLGIPCIGWKGTDTQKNLFPELSVDEGDMERARYLAKQLETNERFYKYVSEFAKSNFSKFYSEEVFKNQFKI